MDRLIAEIEKKTEVKTQQEVAKETEMQVEVETQIQEEFVQSTENEKYLNSFENMTVADFKRQEEEKRIKEFEAERQQLIEKQYEKAEETAPEKTQKQEVSQNIIEKPNYDFLQESDKVVKLSKREKGKKKPVKKRLSLVLAIALGFSAIFCLANVIAIDHMSSNLAQLEYELYEVNLPKYLKDIADLDTTKKGMEFIETYPDQEFDAGESGQKSNWFDKFCNFISGLFGG